MARFRVDQHRHWRAQRAEPAPSATGSTTRAARRPAPKGRREGPDARCDAIVREVRAMGPLGWPARAHDHLFGGWRGNRTTFFALRFILVAVAVGLFFGSALGDAPVSYKTGDYQTVTPAHIVDTYVSEHSVHVIPVVVERAADDRPTASFTSERGIVRVPSVGWGNEDIYGIKLSLVRKDPAVAPILLVSGPGESAHTVPPVSDDGVSVAFKPLRLDEIGKWQLIVRTNEGVGHIEVHAAVARAPVESVEMPEVDLAQLALGGGVLVLLLGAYTPGAALLRERRRIERDAEEGIWRRTPADVPMRVHRSIPHQEGVRSWRHPGPDVHARLGQGSEGWVVRRER